MKKVKNSELLLSYIREGKMMTQREKLWLIVSLSIPSILAQISATVMFFIDASMVGHLGAKASAAIGLVETTGWLMGGLASAANMGFSVQVAHFIGANDFEAARRVLRQSMVCCMAWAMMISLISVIIAPFLPYWMGGSEEIARDASIYFAIFGLAWHLLPNGRAGRLHAEVFRQYEDTLHTEYRYVRDGCAFQLPLYLYPRSGRNGSRHWNGRCHADYGRTDAIFPARQIEDALPRRTSWIV